ncbi:Uncharacterised protein [Amycolatopsis camponoti]|uniref:Uncharacterized protein n=1 Tax=Amycolatopsis camponoti TaxID=2606593 RepID=A0A6I8LKM7_9PSEU|nr:Uncharacterised protein [Amycolatopsis camponoti]
MGNSVLTLFLTHDHAPAVQTGLRQALGWVGRGDDSGALGNWG